MGFRKSYGSLVGSYESFKENSFWGVGQRRIKLFLNSLISKYQKEMIENSDDKELKRNFMLASLYRVLLETEGCNINAKKYCNTSSFSYSDHNYRQKHQLIREACMLCLDYNREFPEEKIVYGYANSDVYNVKYIVYFELPDNGEQVSFHTDLDYNVKQAIPGYKKPWDGISESTLPKLEDAICKRFGDEIRKKYKKEIAEHEEEMRKREEERIRREQQRLEEKRKQEARMAVLLEEALAAMHSGDMETANIKRNAISKEFRKKFDAVAIEEAIEALRAGDMETANIKRNSIGNEFVKKFDAAVIEMLKKDVIETEYGGRCEDFYNKLCELEKEHGNISSLLLNKMIEYKAYVEYRKRYVTGKVAENLKRLSREFYEIARHEYNKMKGNKLSVNMFDVPSMNAIYIENFVGSGKNFLFDINIGSKMRKKMKKNGMIYFKKTFSDDVPKKFELKDIDTLL